MCANMITAIIPSIYFVPGIVLRALPMLFDLTHVTVKYKLPGQTQSTTLVVNCGRGGYLYHSLLNPQDRARCLAHSKYSINIHRLRE